MVVTDEAVHDVYEWVHVFMTTHRTCFFFLNATTRIMPPDRMTTTTNTHTTDMVTTAMVELWGYLH